MALTGIGAVVARSRMPISDPETPATPTATVAKETDQFGSCVGGTLKGSGARMEIFASADTTQAPVQSGLVPILDLKMAPTNVVLPGQRVRWTGWIKSHGRGVYHFSLAKGVSGSLSVSNTPIIDAASGKVDAVGVPMDSAKFYPFTLDVTADDASADAGSWLMTWAPPKHDAEPLTRGTLFPPAPKISKAALDSIAAATAR